MKLARLDLNLLTALDAILATQSVSRAAALLGLSTPAMSHALSRLRAQMADPILVRAGQRWMLSERAAALAPHVREAVERARALLAPNAELDERGLAREFRIHATDYLLSLLGLSLGHAVSEEAPSVSLRFLPLHADEAGALRDDVDLALGVFPDLPPDLRQQGLFTDRYATVVRKGHPLVDGRITLPTFLALRHVVVAPRGRPGSTVDRALAQRGLARRVVRAVPYFLNALEMVADSDCVVTLSARLARHHARRFGLQVLKPPIPLPKVTACQVWHPRVDADPAHAWLRRTVARAAKRTTPDEE